MEGEDLHWGRARQGLIPDLQTQTPPRATDSLPELKFVSAGVTWFPWGKDGKGTDRRADKLPAEFKRKLAVFVLDRRFHGTVNQTGPLVQRLLIYRDLHCLMVGAWADGSSHLHSLAQLLGEQRVLARDRGRPA